MPFGTVGLDKLRHGVIWQAIKVVGYRYENNLWCKAGSRLPTDRFVSERLQRAGLDTFALRDLLDLTKEIESRYEKLFEAERILAQGTDNPHKEWIGRWKDLYLSQFSKVDEEIWEGVGHVVDDSGAVMCVCKTGNGNQYKIIGNRPEELVDWMAGMYMKDGRTTRLAFIQEMIVKRILEYTIGFFREEVTDISILDGEILSAASMGSLYTYKPVMSADGNSFVGYRLDKKKDKISALSYIETSLETFMARHEYRVRGIKTISNDPEEPCYLYIPITGNRGKWDEWKLWMDESFIDATAPKTFMSWIGALLDAGNTGKQCMWLHGRGNDGKSQVANALCEYFGNASVTLSGKSLGNQFAGSKLENKRLVVFADGKNAKLLQSELMHNLTGGDYIDVERKGKNSYSAKTSGKLLVCANHSAEINTDETNQVVRLIYIRMRQRSSEELLKKGLAVQDSEGHVSFIGSSDWPKRLRAQLPAFLAECSLVYGENCPTRSNIIVSKSLTDEMMSSCGDPQADGIAMMCEELFEQDGQGEGVSVKSVREAIATSGKEYGIDGKNNYTMSDIQKYLYNTYNAVKKYGRDAKGKRTWIFANIKLREDTEEKGI